MYIFYSLRTYTDRLLALMLNFQCGFRKRGEAVGFDHKSISRSIHACPKEIQFLRSKKLTSLSTDADFADAFYVRSFPSYSLPFWESNACANPSFLAILSLLEWKEGGRQYLASVPCDVGTERLHYIVRNADLEGP